ncbi:MAG: VanW family protein [Litorilinea sp.]|nr:MAG: VanW family protein [Litorilinea sp.]
MQSTLRLPRSSPRLRRTPLDFVAILVGLLALTLCSLAFFWQFWHTNRIFTGVTVAGVPVGGLTRSEALGQLQRSLSRYPVPPISLAYQNRQWPVTAEQVGVRVDLLAAINQAYLLGRQGNLADRLADQFFLAWWGHEVAPPLQVDENRLRHLVGQVATAVQASQSAAEGGAAAITVDIDATVATLVQALHTNATGAPVQVPLRVQAVAPSAPAPALPVPSEPATPTRGPLLLRNLQFGIDMALDAVTLETVVQSWDPLQLDEGALRTLLESWAQQINLAPRDARLRFDRATGTVTVLQPSQPGRRLDVDATLASIRTALASGAGEAVLAVQPVAPAVDMNRIAEMGIRELVASATTYFAGSSAARVHNIEVAAAKFDGVVIPPGGIFSFNQLVEDVSAANGFEDSLIIWGDRTAVGVGGGVCQVSTTIFRAAYAAGLPIVERYNHGYVVSWYGEPGLDATIFTPTVDLRFRNDTGAYLLIEPVVDSQGGTITFNLYGTRPDRQVIVSKPVISDVIDPGPPVYTVDESLAPGQKKQVEWQQQGMTVKVERTIIENGVSRTETLTSKYQPWRAVYLVGPGTEIPATPTPAPEAAAPSTP